jgi:hypothetical protein
MLPGPDQVIACPHCKGLARHMTLRSGNTFGAQTWTDGKQVAPMLPHPPTVVQCRHCGQMFWLADAEEIGPILPVTEPTEEGYYSAIAGGLAKHAAQEQTLRILAWWCRNDDYRAETGRPARRPWKVSPTARENLGLLLTLLDERDTSERIMKAEILRELGEFDKASEQLRGLESSKSATAVAQILEMCEKHGPRLRVLRFDR